MPNWGSARPQMWQASLNLAKMAKKEKSFARPFGASLDFGGVYVPQGVSADKLSCADSSGEVAPLGSVDSAGPADGFCANEDDDDPALGSHHVSKDDVRAPDAAKSSTHEARDASVGSGADGGDSAAVGSPGILGLGSAMTEWLTPSIATSSWIQAMTIR